MLLNLHFWWSITLILKNIIQGQNWRGSFSSISINTKPAIRHLEHLDRSLKIGCWGVLAKIGREVGREKISVTSLLIYSHWYRRIVVREGSRYLPKTAGDLPPGTARVGTAPLFPLFMPLYIYNTHLYKYIHIDTNMSKYLYWIILNLNDNIIDWFIILGMQGGKGKNLGVRTI